MVGRKSPHRDIERVGSRSQIRETEVSRLVCCHISRTADQCRRDDANLPFGNGSPLFVLDRSNKSSCQLSRNHARKQNACGEDDHDKSSFHLTRSLAVFELRLGCRTFLCLLRRNPKTKLATEVVLRTLQSESALTSEEEIYEQSRTDRLLAISYCWMFHANLSCR